MNKRQSVDVESAYGSEISSNSGYLIKKETFKMEEPALNNHIWYQWLKNKTHEYMVLEAVFFLILVFLLINSYRITSQNQETQAMILRLQSQFNSFQQKTTGEDISDVKEETEEVIDKKNEEVKGMLEEVLKEVRVKSISPTPFSPVINLNKTASISNASITRFNAASLIAGATIDTSRSSSSNLNPTFGFDQSSMVLVDRPDPPADKAWCTYEKEPVLTVNLAKYVKPIAVSYQHSKWTGIISEEAPKVYDVVSCLDYYCENWEPLVSGCVYRVYMSNIQEQVCRITININNPIGKVQFRFRNNHGNTERTCVSLIRVFAETEEAPKIKERTLEDAQICSDLTYNYHHNPITYTYFNDKNCTRLYSKGCCQECPECCEECFTEETSRGDSICITVLFSMFSLIVLLPITLCVIIAFCGCK